MEIVHEAVDEYLNVLTRVDNPILKEMEEYGMSRNFPIVGPVVGRFLMQIALILGAKRILELGSGFGYSAAWFLQALPPYGVPPDGGIICTDFSDENTSRGYDYLNRLGAKGRVKFIKGDALEVIAGIEGMFDIIFNDVDKKDYPRAFKQALPRVRSGGLLIADNTLWKGKVADANPDETTRAIQEFNELIFNTPGVISTIIPLRDGISVSLKL